MCFIAHYIIWGTLFWISTLLKSLAKQKLRTLTCLHAVLFFCRCDTRFLIRFVNCSSEALIAATAPDDPRARPVNVDLTV